MESGRIYRNVTSALFWWGVMAIVLFVFIYLYDFFFPWVYEGNPFVTLVAAFLLISGIATMIVGGPSYYGIWRTRKATLKEIQHAIESAQISKPIRTSQLPAFLLADSIDREILSAVHDLGGDILAIEDRLESRALPTDTEFYRRLAKIHLLGLVELWEEEGVIALTSAGVDALNTPAIFFVTGIPQRVWRYVFQAKIQLAQEKWGTVAVETAKAIEAAMRDKLEIVLSDNDEKLKMMREEISPRPIEKWPAGQLQLALQKFEEIKKGSLEHYLVSELVKIRNMVHDKKEAHTFGPSDAEKCDLYLSLLLRSWYVMR